MNVALESPPPPKRTSGTPVGLFSREEFYHRHTDCAHLNNKRRHEHVVTPQSCFGIDSSVARDGASNFVGVANQETSHYYIYNHDTRVPLVDSSQHSQQKRTRLQASTQVYQDRQRGSGIWQTTKNTETLFKALKALFPRMSDESIAHVLEECGDDIDSAIRRLNDLQLSTPSCSKETASKSPSRSESQHSVRNHTIVVKTEWVDTLVEQMSVAQDVDDAKQRATQVLQSALLQSHQEVSEHIDALQKENTILKRAVGIQNSKIHELSEDRKNVDQVLSEVHELKEKCHALEVQNYSLQLHLKQATSQQDGCRTPGGAPNNPDVF